MTPSPYGRAKWAGAGAGAALAMVGVIWTVASLIQSPQDALASAEPPPPSVITAAVELRSLDSSIQAQGHLSSATRVTGKLLGDQRTRASRAQEVDVRINGVPARASLIKIELDGTFVLRLADAVPTDRPQVVDVQFEAAATAPGFVVPISALFTAAGGHTAVIVVHNERQREVTIKMGEAVDGFVQVDPIEPGELKKNDQVLVSEPRGAE